MHACSKRIFFLLFSLLIQNEVLHAQRQQETLGRGLIALRHHPDSVFLSWRMLASDEADISFNLYRTTGSRTVRLNRRPITATTTFTDRLPDTTNNHAYTVRAIRNGKEESGSPAFVWRAQSPVQAYLAIPLQNPAGYTPNDLSAGDLDGDGEYELVVHQAGRSRDNGSAGFTDPPVFQAYRLDGTLLWTINLGRNIREGAHYTQFMVYDLDGDGRAEVAMKTADGTVDGRGQVLGDSSKDWRNRDGKILEGPEYLTVFSGQTGAALATTGYLPPRGDIGAWGGKGGNGGNDRSGNRVDRFLACVAYLDGKRPSLVMCRGYYGRSVLAAWDYRNGKLTSRWVFDSHNGDHPFSGQGNHNLSVADVDGDRKDEIIYGSMVVDDNGTGLYSTGLRHGDALHVTDLDPSRKGLEVFGVHEIEEHTTGPGAALFDAGTGAILWQGHPDQDAGRGVAANIEPKNPGAEIWWSGSGGLYNLKGERIGPGPPSTNFLIYWDGDRTRELLDGNHIDKYGVGRLFTAEGCTSNNGTKATPALSADLLGDWREEVVFRTLDNKELRLFSTTLPTTCRMPTLMHDPVYRLGIAWQNVGYNQPPHTGFYLGEDQPLPKRQPVAPCKASPSRARNMPSPSK